MTALEAHLHQTVAALEAIRATALPRLLLIEEEYKQAVLESELTWIQSLLDDMRTGEITWNEQWLRQVAATFGNPDRT